MSKNHRTATLKVSLLTEELDGNLLNELDKAREEVMQLKWALEKAQRRENAAHEKLLKEYFTRTMRVNTLEQI